MTPKTWSRRRSSSYGAPQLFVFTLAVLFSAFVGAVSFAGSAVAFAKLQGI